MSDINLDFTVSNNSIDFTVQPNDITITPTDIQLNIYGSSSLAEPGGSNTQLQYNNNGLFAGIPTVTWNGTNISLGNVSTVKITGGANQQYLKTDGTGNLVWANVTLENANVANFANVAFSVNANSTSNVVIRGGVNGYVLQTDGTGNLTWTAQTGGGGGNGSPGGANTQIQYNDSGNFGGNTGFTFNELTGNVAIPGNISIAGNLVGNLSVTGIANLGSVSNVKITGGTANYTLKTDGAGNLSWQQPAGSGNWSNVSNIQVSDIFFGVYYGANSALLPGSSVNVAPANINVNTWTISNSLITNSFSGLTSTTDYIVAVVDSEANITRTQTSSLWAKVSTPFIPTNMVSTGDRIIIYRSGSNNSAYSDNNGANWTYANNINTTLNLRSGAYGNGTIIITRSENTSNNFIKSHNLGVTWSNSNIGFTTQNFNGIAYGNGKFIATKSGNATAIRTTDGGNTWANISLGNAYLWRQFAYGNGKWVGVSEYTGSTTRGAVVVSTDDGDTWSTTLIANVRWATAGYANGTFILGNADDANILVSTDAVTWSTVNVASPANANTFNASTGVAFNSRHNLIVLTGTNSGNVAGALTPAIVVPSSDGNLSNAQAVPTGTYKTLGGGVGNVGSMWIRTA